jgi:hypothetical protein
LVRHVSEHDPKPLVKSSEALTRAQIAATVKALTLQFTCDAARYREDAHIVRDLGLD